LRHENPDEPIAIRCAIGQRIRLAIRQLQIFVREVVFIGDRDPSTFQIGDVGDKSISSSQGVTIPFSAARFKDCLIRWTNIADVTTAESVNAAVTRRFFHKIHLCSEQ